MSIGRNMIDHWLFFAPNSGCRGTRLIRSWPPLASAQQCTRFSGRSVCCGLRIDPYRLFGFLIICYLAAFDEQEIRAAAEWFRYQAHSGGAGLLVALMLAMERWRVVFGPAVWWCPPESYPFRLLTEDR